MEYNLIYAINGKQGGSPGIHNGTKCTHTTTPKPPSSPADLGRNMILTSGCIIGACCQVNTCEVIPENTVIFGSGCQRRVQTERPQVHTHTEISVLRVCVYKACTYSLCSFVFLHFIPKNQSIHCFLVSSEEQHVFVFMCSAASDSSA